MMESDKQHEYRYNVDFYWKSLAMYGAALLLYAAFKGTIDEKTLSLALNDPIIILLACFVFLSALSLFVNHHAQRAIIIGYDYILFKNRLRKKVISLSDIVSITLVKDRRFKVNTLSAIKIRIRGRRRPIRLRPSLFEHEEQLMQDIKHLRQHVIHQKGQR